jgi:DNA-binding CsgD family transcriptional regulator
MILGLTIKKNRGTVMARQGNFIGVSTFDEIAKNLNLSLGTVVSTYYRALRKLSNVKRLKKCLIELEALNIGNNKTKIPLHV